MSGTDTKNEPPKEQSPSSSSPDFKSKLLEVESMEQTPPNVPLQDGAEPLVKDRYLAVLSIIMNSVESSVSLDDLPCKVLILEALYTWLQVYYAYGFRFEAVEVGVLCKNIRKTYEMAAAFARAQDWLTYFKYRNASFFSVWNDQPLPDRPQNLSESMCKNDKYLFGGPFVGFLNQIRRNGQMRSFSLSILQSKKGMPRPTDEMVEEAEEKNFLTMTTPKPEKTWEYRWEIHYETLVIPTAYEFTRSFLESEIDRTCAELFRTWRPELDLLTQYFLPSSSSNYNRTRNKFGTYGELQHVEGWREFVKSAEGKLKFKAKMTKLSGYVSEYYGAKGQEDQLAYQDLQRQVVGLEIDDRDFLVHWRAFYWKCVALALKEEPLVEVVGLKEALKIRCISKGPPLTYFVLKPFQKSMLQQLQKTWNFELTGTPITEELMNKRFGQFVGSNMHSGDYKSATDEIYSWASNRAANACFDVAEKNLGYTLDVFRVLFIRALTGHVYVRGNLKLAQLRGQLMGSIVSFIILCILNATLIRKTFELSEGRIVLIRDAPFWINGDDCLTAYNNPNFATLWRGLGSVMGFTESVGKTYDSKHFCSINSNFFEALGGVWKLIPYINLGLVACLGRSVGAKAPPRPHLMALGVCHRDLLSPLSGLLRERANRLFLRRHSARLDSYKGSWFLPVWLGGLGLKNLRDYTRKELLYAAAAKTAIGTGTQPPSYKTTKEWAQYDSFMKRCRSECPLLDSYSFANHEGESNYGPAFCATTIDNWMASGIHGIYNPVEVKEQKTLGECMKFMRKVQTLLADSEFRRKLKPCAQEEVDVETKRKVIPIWLSGVGTSFWLE